VATSLSIRTFDYNQVELLKGIGSVDWEVTTDSGKMALRPFEAVTAAEPYRLYRNART